MWPGDRAADVVEHGQRRGAGDGLAATFDPVC
jgi:hypothetical protein